MPAIRTTREVIVNKVRIVLIIILCFPCLGGFAQEFGCFTEPSRSEMDGIYYKQMIINENHDSIFWLYYTVPTDKDGYFKSWWNKYQIKMEGNIIDGKREGIWLLYLQYDNSFCKVNFVHGIKEGEWGKYSVKGNDTLREIKGFFKNDLEDGIQTLYKTDTVVKAIWNFTAGKLNGVVISYAFTDNNKKYIDRVSYYKQDKLEAILSEYDLDKNDHPFLRYFREFNTSDQIGKSYTFSNTGDTLSIKEYSEANRNGITVFDQRVINGKSLLLKKTTGDTFIEVDYSENGDTTEFLQYSKNSGGVHKLFKLDSTDMKWKLNKIIRYSNYDSDGVYTQIYNNGQPAFEFEIKNGLPYNVHYAYSYDGQSLDAGTLREGNGVMNFYYPNGGLRSNCAYCNSKVKGKLITFYENGTIEIDAYFFGIDDSAHKYGFSGYTDDDINKYYWNQNLNGMFKRFYKDQSPMNVINYDSITGLTSYHYYYDNGNTSSILTRKYLKLTGKYISFYENGGTKATGNYSITNKNTSVKDSVWNYYYKDGLLQSSICYQEGNKTGHSNYYDQEGKLRRIEVFEKDGTNYSLFDGDTVNFTDVNKKKQGKWISLPISVQSDDGGCNDNVSSIKYYKDNKPTKTWTISEDERYFKTYDKEVYVWQDSSLAYCYRYFSANNQLKSEGDIINMSYKFGLWKEYDSEKGYLKYEGNYYLNERVGSWKVYKKNGKVKKIIDARGAGLIINRD